MFPQMGVSTANEVAPWRASAPPSTAQTNGTQVFLTCSTAVAISWSIIARMLLSG